MKFKRICYIFGLVVLVLPLLARAQQVTVSAAISLKEALTDIAGEYQKKTGDRVQLNFGASGILANQIEAGAPVDLFISAAIEPVEKLSRAKLNEGGPRIVVRNRLVLIVPPGSSDIKSWDDLPGARRVSIGDPKVVPAGRYAAEVLRKKKLLKKLEGKLVYGANVRQVLAYVERGEVEAGLVYSTDAEQAGKKVSVIATAETNTHEPIEYPALIVKNGNRAAARKFLDFLFLDSSQKIFARFGFETDPMNKGKGA